MQEKRYGDIKVTAKEEEEGRKNKRGEGEWWKTALLRPWRIRLHSNQKDEGKAGPLARGEPER